MEHNTEPKSFAPKHPVELAPPKDDPITYEELAKCDGVFEIRPSPPSWRQELITRGMI
jgi:membrane-associated progesterone receptor component